MEMTPRNTLLLRLPRLRDRGFRRIIHQRSPVLTYNPEQQSLP